MPSQDKACFSVRSIELHPAALCIDLGQVGAMQRPISARTAQETENRESLAFPPRSDGARAKKDLRAASLAVSPSAESDPRCWRKWPRAHVSRRTGRERLRWRPIWLMTQSDSNRSPAPKFSRRPPGARNSNTVACEGTRMRGCPGIDRCSCGALLLPSTASIVGTQSTVVTAAAVRPACGSYCSPPPREE